jgi:hypothetical protein
MAWYRTDLYHRVLAYSLTAVNQQWPPSAERVLANERLAAALAAKGYHY